MPRPRLVPCHQDVGLRTTTGNFAKRGKKERVALWLNPAKDVETILLQALVKGNPLHENRITFLLWLFGSAREKSAPREDKPREESNCPRF
jgi:hypothetical protein